MRTSDTIELDLTSAPEFGRRETLLYTVRRSYQLCDKPPVIVEIGTSRDERPEACNGDGWSTRIWGWYAAQDRGTSSEQQGRGKAYTVDIDPEAIEACRRITAEQTAAIEYVVSDSIEFLQNWNAEECGKIDLLYLDGLDHFASGSEEHHLSEAQAALPNMAERCLVLIDDTFPDPGLRGTRNEHLGTDSFRRDAGKSARSEPEKQIPRKETKSPRKQEIKHRAKPFQNRAQINSKQRRKTILVVHTRPALGGTHPSGY